MADHAIPTRADIDSYLADRRNWGRWGDKGAAGAMNLTDDAKRLDAVGPVKKGGTVARSRPFRVTPAAEHPKPAGQILVRDDRPRGGRAVSRPLGRA